MEGRWIAESSSSKDVCCSAGSSLATTSPVKPSNEYVLNVAFISFFGFTVFQFFFAITAHSHSMMVDCAAMTVDVVTYLFNYLAERYKRNMQFAQSGHRRDDRLKSLYIELIPPLISVVTLVVVTTSGFHSAVNTLREPPQDQSVQPDLGIMLAFSGLNMFIDALNVTCFARVDQALGLATLTKGMHEATAINTETPTESSDLLPQVDDSDKLDTVGGLNLNMCSAWTHVCADTLRSIAVLVAAGVAFLFPHHLTPADADSWGTIVVSAIILVSLVPLFEGLYLTVRKIQRLSALNSA